MAVLKQADSKLVSYLDPNGTDNYNTRTAAEDVIIPHHAGNGNGCDRGYASNTLAVIFASVGKDGSVHYGIDSNGKTGQQLSEKYRPWTSNSRTYDMRAVTIEVANDSENYTISDKALAALTALCTDICRRRGKKKLLWIADKSRALKYKPAQDEMLLLIHTWVADPGFPTGCPGSYMISRMPYLAENVTKKLSAGTPDTKPAAVKMTYDQFESKYLGKAIDYDGTAGVQCVDLADQYLKDCFGITGVWVNGAKDFYNNFNSYPALVDAFTRVANTRDLVVEKGDIVVWGGGTWGHVAIGNGEGDIDWFRSLEENTLGRHEPTQLVKHTFAGRTGVDCDNPVLGVLRPKDKSIKNCSPYLVKITYTSGLNIRKGPGVGYQKVGSVPYNGVYTIVQEQAVSGQTWGKLKSGAGWICLTGFTKKI